MGPWPGWKGGPTPRSWPSLSLVSPRPLCSVRVAERVGGGGLGSGVLGMQVGDPGLCLPSTLRLLVLWPIARCDLGRGREALSP